MTIPNKICHFLNFNSHITNDTMIERVLDLDMLEKVKHNIKTIRESRNLSREQLAQMMNVDDNVVKRMEWGNSSLGIERLNKVAECLNMSVIDIITFPDKYVNSSFIPGQSEKLEALVQIRLSKGYNENTLKLESIEIK